MSNHLTVRGNLAAAPELKHVSVNGEDRQVAELRMYCDRRVPDGDGDFKDKGGFWLNVSRWGVGAEHAARVLDKGHRVAVSGTLVQNSWEKDGEKFSRFELNADDIALDLSRIESVTLRPRQSPASADTGTSNDPPDGGPDGAATGDVDDALADDIPQ